MMICDEISLVDFIHGELKPNETESVLRHLENCDDCRERLRATAAVEAFYREERARSREKAKRWLLAAGVLVAVSVALFTALWQDATPATIELADLATGEIYPYFPLETRSEDPSEDLEIQRTFEAYNRGDFREAVERMSRLPASAEHAFYAGVSLYVLGDYEEALVELGKAEQWGPHWKTPVLWYRANVFLKLNEGRRAREALEEIVEEGDEDYEAKAKELLEKLENS